MTGHAPDGAPLPDVPAGPSDDGSRGLSPTPARSSSTARLLLLAIIAALALVFFAVFGRQIGQMQPGLGDPQVIYGAPSPTLESPP